MLPQAFAIDLDGTLLIGEDLPPANRDAVRRAHDAGIRIIIATARWRQMAQRVAAEIGISAPIIACSGAQVYEPAEDRDVFDHRLPEAFARTLVDLCNAERCVATFTYDDHTLVKLSGDPDPALFTGELSWCNALPAVGGGVALPRIAAVQGSGVNAVIRNELESAYADDVNIYDSIGPNGKIILTITAKAASKGAALRAACAHDGIDPAGVVAFGDAENDIEMFRVAGQSVAMGQADDKVKAAATRITTANTDAGVARAIDAILAGP